MADIPWSLKPKVNELSLSDLIMRSTPSQATKNQETPFSDVIPFIYENISLLTDGKDTQTSAAEVAFIQGNESFRGPVRPNPVNQINVRNQAQLEDELGSNLEIPDEVELTVVLDDSFTLIKPFKVGNNSGFQLRQSKIGPRMQWDGPGAMIQNIDSLDEARFLSLENVSVRGDGTNSFLDVKIVSTGFSTFFGVSLSNLDSIGTLDTPAVVMSRITGFTINKGIVLVNTGQLTLDTLIFGNFSATNTTWISVISDIISLIAITNANASNFAAGDSLLFLDPNSDPDAAFVVALSRITVGAGEGEFYQLGTDIAIDSVTDGAPNAEFNTASAHGLAVGKPVVLSGFATSAYNRTFIVTVVDTPLTGTKFETGVAFDIDESIGMMNKSSLDQTDVRVNADDNPVSPDSQTISESRTNGGLEVDGSGEIDVPIVDITPVAGDWIQDATTERFSVDDTTGIVTYIGKKSVTVMIKYSMTVEATSGPAAQNLIIDLHINGIAQTKAGVTVTTAAGGVKVTYNGGNFEINTGDTFQLFKDNITNDSNTNVVNAILLINLN